MQVEFRGFGCRIWPARLCPADMPGEDPDHGCHPSQPRPQVQSHPQASHHVLHLDGHHHEHGPGPSGESEPPLPRPAQAVGIKVDHGAHQGRARRPALRHAVRWIQVIQARCLPCLGRWKCARTACRKKQAFESPTPKPCLPWQPKVPADQGVGGQQGHDLPLL